MLVWLDFCATFRVHLWFHQFRLSLPMSIDANFAIHCCALFGRHNTQHSTPTQTYNPLPPHTHTYRPNKLSPFHTMWYSDRMLNRNACLWLYCADHLLLSDDYKVGWMNNINSQIFIESGIITFTIHCDLLNYHIIKTISHQFCYENFHATNSNNICLLSGPFVFQCPSK